MTMLRIGPWDDVLRAAGFDPDQIYLTKRYDERGSRELFARVRRVARTTGRRHQRELDKLHRECGSFVQQKYGGWRELALQLGLPPRQLVKRRGWDRESLIEALRDRKRRGLGLRPGEPHVEDKGLYHFGSWDAGLRRAGMSGTERLDVVRYADLHTLESDLKLLLAGRLRANAERRRALFRYAERLRGSVIGALEEAGASRSRALSIAASPWPAYPSGDAVLVALETRRRAGLDVDFRHVKSGRHRDPDLAKAARCLFGSWEAAVAATASPSRNERPRASRRS